MKQFPVPGFLRASNIYEVNIRQYTPEGTFAAFSQHLPRLREMGVDILWLMPIHPIGIPHRKGSLGSYYSISNHQAVNPEFGSMEDFDRLLAQVHELGMKLILDWVANHTAWDHVWTVQAPQYFVRDEFGFQSPFDWTDVIQVDHQNEDQQKAMIAAMRFWVEEKGVDGFRADLAHLTPLDFWVKARKEIDALRPDLVWLAESEDPAYTQAFDITFTWKWMHESQRFLKAGEDISLLKDFLSADELPGLRLYFTSNHDENTWNGTEMEKYGVYAKALAVFSCLYRESVPLIYSGQECANEKRLSFFEKDAISWPEVPALQDFYSKLLHLRHKPGLLEKAENFRWHSFSQLLCFSQHSTTGSVWVFLHLGTEPAEFQPFHVAGTTGTEIFSGVIVDASSGPVIMQPGDFLVFESFRKGD